MILVLLGTQKNSFHRLLEEIQNCIDNKLINEKVIVQAGCTKFKSNDMELFDLISEEELNKLRQQANIIITHGGVGSIVGTLKMHKKIIAIPRLSEFNEHVNNHQTQIVKTFNDKGFIIGIQAVEELPQAIVKVQEFEPQEFISNTENVIKIISDFIDNN